MSSCVLFDVKSGALGGGLAHAVWSKNSSPTVSRCLLMVLYEPRCGHGSTLSPALHAQVAARLGAVDVAERYLHQTADIDDLDSPIASRAGGVHIAALGGLWMATVFGFAGFRTLGEELAFDPILPEKWQSLAFCIQWRSRLIHVRIDRKRGLFTATLERGEPVVLRVNGNKLVLQPGFPRQGAPTGMLRSYSRKLVTA